MWLFVGMIGWWWLVRLCECMRWLLGWVLRFRWLVDDVVGFGWCSVVCCVGCVWCLGILDG